MKLIHRRRFSGVWYVSVNHYSYKDATATKLANEIRARGLSARVVTDVGIGYTHVFVPERLASSVDDLVQKYT
jgi:hypothetical protein